MKVVTRLIDLMVAFCIEQYCHYVSGRQLIAQADAPTCPCPGEKQDAVTVCRPLKLDLDKSGI
ncbi:MULTISPECIES: hypothetical protein [Bradyrhizobium]|uniref:Uncharacterized protein n=1 Tax=Bradyrhizobium elkanii TaxID=29448 RepID=A0A4U6RZI7_BRAEL|nr:MULTISPECIES: hypothetical protein [Bradyrhizobium]MTV11725.1 hypothetical protein [Bradyrhizobium sp. BR2003]TKV77786.1 hypothetical protein FDV58_29850 [Bradyrhizobium elkanii]